MEEVGEPGVERREYLLGVLAELVGRDGAAPLLAPPVAPGSEGFPERWEPTPRGAHTLLKRLAWHAGQSWRIRLVDERRGALATERKPETHLELREVRKNEIVLALSYIGEDEVVGTFAHEIGLAYAIIVRANTKDPYRAAADTVISVDPSHDLDRGSIATVYLGLGVLAANACFPSSLGHRGPSCGEREHRSRCTDRASRTPRRHPELLPSLRSVRSYMP